MDDDQVLNQLLAELPKTRESFDKAIESVRWNRVNTIIQYALIVVIFILGSVGVVYYQNEKHNDCESDNALRSTVIQGMEANAFAIGAALAVVFNAPQERLEQYLEAYSDQHATDEIQLQEC